MVITTSMLFNTYYIKATMSWSRGGSGPLGPTPWTRACLRRPNGVGRGINCASLFSQKLGFLSRSRRRVITRTPSDRCPRTVATPEIKDALQNATTPGHLQSSHTGIERRKRPRGRFTSPNVGALAHTDFRVA